MKIAYITNGFSSNLNSSYELCRRLELAGHEVTYFSTENVGQRVRDNGYPFTRLTEQDRLMQSFASLEPAFPLTPGWISNRKHKQKFQTQMLGSGELLAAIDEFRTDLLVIDIELHFTVLVCLQLGLPIILTMCWFSIFNDGQLPPMHTTLAPPVTDQEKQTISALWEKESRLKRKKRIRNQARHSLRNFFSPVPVPMDTLDTAQLNMTARYHGLDLDNLVDYGHWLRPMVFSHLPVLSFNIYEMDFPHTKHTELHYVGPMIYQQRVDPGADQKSKSKWTDLLRRYRQQQINRPLVYCSSGTFWRADIAFLTRVIEIFKIRADWQLVIGLGGKCSSGAFSPIPDNVTVLEWAPQLQILEMASCAITHGGITSINECVRFGVPMLVYSTAHGDQNGCAVRVAWHGLGIMGDRTLDDSRQMALHIESLINNPGYKDRLELMRNHFKRYEQENAAVEIIEQAGCRGRNS